MTKKVDAFAKLEADVISSNTYSYFSYLLAPRASDIYLAIKLNDNTDMGFLRLSDFSSSTSIDWYQKLTCTSCYPTAIAESSHSSSYLYFASVESTDVKIRHFDDTG